MRPMESYFDVLPDHADTFSAAYHFLAEYESGSRAHLELQSSLRGAINRWRGLWRQDETAPPTLSVHPLDDDMYLLLDSRFDLSQPVVEFVDGKQMRVLLTGEHDGDARILTWARERRYLVAIDDHWVPLVTSDPETLAAALGTKRPLTTAAKRFSPNDASIKS